MLLSLMTVVALIAHVAHAEFVAPEVPDGWTFHHDVLVGKLNGTELRIDIVAPDAAPEKPLPVIAYIHGGGWNHGSKNDHSRRLAGIAKRGYIGAALSYRLAPTYHYPAQIEDIQAAVRFLKAHAGQYHLDPARIALWGTSAGGHLAAQAGVAANNVSYKTHGLWEEQNASVFAVVDFSGPTSSFLEDFANQNPSLRAFLGGTPKDLPEVAAEAMPITHVDVDDPPIFVAHGDADPVVPVVCSRLFVKALREAGVKVEYHEVKGGDHGLNPSNAEAQDLAYKFLERLFAAGE